MLMDINININSNIKYIDSLDIYNTKLLISDTLKHNINKKKIYLIDIYNKQINKINSIKNNIIIESSKELLLSDHKNLIDINKIFKYVIENKNTIDIFSYYLKHENNNEDIKNTMFNNIKNIIFNSNNSNIIISKIPSIRKPYISFKYTNIVYNFNKFKYKEYDNNLSKLLYKNLSLKSNIKITNLLKKSNFDNIYKLVSLYNNTFKKNIIIIILDSNKENINYNIKDLLDKNIKITTTNGINYNYIKKSNTLTTNENEITDYYISAMNINKIHIINGFTSNKILNFTIEEYNTEVLLINSINSRFELYNNQFNKILLLKDVINIILNKPDNNIEIYNDLIQNQILNQIEQINILENYKKNFSLDINVYKDVDITNLKEEIINKIKKIKIVPSNLDDKQNIIENILNIILKSITNYIQTKNKIDLTPELYITSYSSINKLLSKFKKELVDNYDENIIENIDKLINNLKKSIVKIDELMIEKSYYTKIKSIGQ